MSRLSNFVLGYHGCGPEALEAVISRREEMARSDRDYDWLGPGVYFWENDAQRAREWAEERVSAGKYERACVIGAVLDLGNCLNLMDRENLELLRFGYQDLARRHELAGVGLPANRDVPKDPSRNKLLRFLDCAVIRALHQALAERAFVSGGPMPFDSVRGLFVEGEPIYPGAGFYSRTHVQLAIVNPACIRHVFVV